MTPGRRRLLIGAVAAAGTAAIMLPLSDRLWPRRPVPDPVPWRQVTARFDLVNQEGRRTTERDFDGRLLLVYFGYTFCPDMCPTALAVMAAAMDELGEELASHVQPILITVDPERDTPAVLAGYVPLFHPTLIGLTGTAEQIARTAADFHIQYRKVHPSESAATDYLMDHTGFIFLIGTDRKIIRVFGQFSDPVGVAEAIRKQFETERR